MGAKVCGRQEAENLAGWMTAAPLWPSLPCPARFLLRCVPEPPVGAPQKRRAVKLSKDSELFEAGQLGSVPGGGTLTTYKELCSLATELGQPDLGEWAVMGWLGSLVGKASPFISVHQGWRQQRAWAQAWSLAAGTGVHCP